MPLTIQPLPIDAVYLIGAGEVIDSLAAAVRELAENALDAGATRVAIAIDLDRWSIRVADNGHGMSRDDLQQAARPHTTSKIFHRQDLHAIHTLGFRGEALHSLAQLARLDISSHQADTDEGWCVQYDAQGEVIACESVAIAPGTIVTASQIFESWPHRREAMPSAAQQLRQIQRHVQHLALCHPHVTWTVTQGERDWFSIFPGTSAKTILPQCVRDIHPEDLQEYCQSEFQSEFQAELQ
ncbi:MAG: DNA mismatch repair endonuclease MutL, partial [Leptolyngbyaceae bacterium]|nr:DNA mismatch repair endonuclease MutL [Leptolyngbyaceae bacterium]